MGIYIGIIIVVALIGLIWQNNAAAKAAEESRKIQYEKERKEQRRLEELKYEKLTVVYATVEENGKPKAIVKRNDNKYITLERRRENAPPYELNEIIKLEKKLIKDWGWYDEIEYTRILTQYRETNVIRKKKAEKQKQQDLFLNNFGIDYLFHMTHKNNLQKILQNGLKSHNYARSNGLLQNDIADNQVNDRRSKREPIYNRSLHDYVPLYFNPKNPMLSVRRNIQDDIVILAINKRILFQENILFTNGNAAANITSFYQNPEELSNLKWDCIKSEYWNGFEDGKRLRCSEVLVYPEIPVTSIQKIFCNNTQTKEFTETMSAGLPYIKTEINYNLYF